MSVIGTSEGFINFTNGTPRADKIIATSNIGIGTDAPAYELDVVGNVHANSFYLENFFISSSRGLDHVTNENNSTGDTIISTNAATGFQASSNIVIGGDIHVSGNIYQNGSEFINIGTLNTTDAITMPSGTTAERPSTAVEGMLRHNSESGYFEYYTSGGWSSIVTSPGVISFSPNPIAYANATTEDITINGSLFDNQSLVRLEDTNGITYNTSNISFVDDSTITFRIGTLADGQFANRPYRVLVTDRLGYTTKSAETLRFGNPSITSFSPNPIAYANITTEFITVSGTFFDNQSNVQLEGADGTTLYNTTNFTFVDTGTLRFRMGTLVSGQGINRPYKIVVTDAAGVTVKSAQTLGFPNPTWSSPASGSTEEFYTVGSKSLTLSATDALGNTYINYTLVNGTIPGGLTFSGNTISGTSTESDGTTNTVTIRATDSLDTSKYTDLTFTIKSVAALYTFSSHTFTSAGLYGQFGPTLTQLRTAYTPAWTDYTSNLNVTTQGIQEWTVPKTGTYQIRAVGSGSYTANQGGYGADITGTCTLTVGEIIKILVGQVCESGSGLANHCGGGGTFVVRSPYNTNNSIIVVAGGGGGAHNYGFNTNANASLTTDGNQGWQNLGNGGTNGNAGGNGSGFGGAGFFGNNTSSAKSFTNGGTGDLIGTYQAGFGGGGRHGNSHGGGGGGYSGGGGSTNNPYNGGGGGSYTANITVSSQASTHDGNGFVVITFIN